MPRSRLHWSVNRQRSSNEVVRINAEARDRALGMSLLVLGLVALLGLLVSLRLPEGSEPSCHGANPRSGPVTPAEAGLRD